MVKIFKVASAIATALVIGTAVAHPGEKLTHAQIKREVQARTALSNKAYRSLSDCASSPNARALQERAVKRRAATAERLRKERGLKPQEHYLSRRNLTDLEKWETINHNLTGSIDTSDVSNLFGANTSCILTPEETVGPYWVEGELVRQNVTEGQAGVEMHLEMQLVDVNTCEPVSDVLVDIWNCNSTGTYSGVTAEDTLQSTFLRGLQETDADGVVEFDTLFPGHYSGRATHTHTIVHVNSTLLPNGSYSGGVVSHIGQIYYEEDLRSAVEATTPYNTNTIEILSNDDDMWSVEEASAAYDPIVNYVYLGADITDGLLAWISIGVDPSANYTDNATAAAYWADDGGHALNLTLGGF